MLAVVAVLVVLMYPAALLLGLPLAKKRMENLANWVISEATLHPLAAAPTAGEGASAGTQLAFASFGEVAEGGSAPAVERLVLVRGNEVQAASFELAEDGIVLSEELTGPFLTWGAELIGPVGVPAGAAGHRFLLPEGSALASGSALFMDDRVLEGMVADATERPDGVSKEFTFPFGEGPILVDGELFVEGVGFQVEGQRAILDAPPPFNSEVKRLAADYALLTDSGEGVVVLAEASATPPRLATDVLALAELLVGNVDGSNRTFYLQHHPLVEGDPGRQLMLGERELSAAAERPQERVDGERAAFTFAGERGVVTVNGVEVEEGRDFSRDGNVLTFTPPPPRNAQLRQYRDYRISDGTTGAVSLAVAPQPGEKLWAAAYSFYDRPACGATELECFFSMPQHPMPFPHWIAQRLWPFLTAYPVTDSRSVVRATLYTAVGTLFALALGGALGVLLAIIFVAVRPAERALLPWVIASQTVPIIALVPVLLLLLGNVGVTVQTSLVPAALIGAYIAFFPVSVGTVTGLRSVDPLALDLMKSYAATPLEVFFKVRFPAAVPFFFTSLKLGAAAALVGALVAETESNNRYGLGYSIVGQVQAGNVSDVWILLLISAFLGIGLVALVGLTQRVIAPWDRR